MTNTIPSSNRDCNKGNIYTRLVVELTEQGRPLEGYIAYTLYKGEKLEYMKTFIASHPNASENAIQKEKDNFRISHCQNSEITKYKKHASEIAEKVREADLRMIHNEILNNEREYFSEKITSACKNTSANLSESIKTEIDNWWRNGKKSRTMSGVWQSVLGALIYALLLAIFGFIIKNSDVFPIVIGSAN